jgi:hypothetical protein
VALARIWSSVPVQVKGWVRLFQPVMKARIFAEVADAGEAAAPDGLPLDDREPDLDQR